MRVILSAILAVLNFTFAGPAFAQAGCPLGKSAANMPAEFSQFDFIIGNFDFNYRQMTDDGWSEPLGTARWNG